MNLKKSLYIVGMAAFTAFSMPSCNNYLDLKPFTSVEKSEALVSPDDLTLQLMVYMVFIQVTIR